MKTIKTIGYAGHDQDSFLQCLLANDVEILVDVRQRAGSRKPAFNKSRLIELTGANGIQYQHYPRLGTPAELRKKLKTATITREAYMAAYRAHLDDQGYQIAALTELAMGARCCLMCLEKDPAECHRSILADVLVEWIGGAVDVEHIVGADRVGRGRK